MRIGLYIRRLSGLGGGERHALAIAEALAKYHPVEVLTHTPTPAAKVIERFNIDLSRIAIRYLPEMSIEAMSQETASYDLFINSLHNTFVPALSKYSAMLIFFPIQANLLLDARIRRTVAHLINQQLTLFRYEQGIYAEERVNNARLRLLDQNASIALQPSRVGHTLQFGLQNSAPEARRVQLWLDESLEQEITLAANSTIDACTLEIAGSRRSAEREIRFEITGDSPVFHGGIKKNIATRVGHQIDTKSSVRLVDFRSTHPRHRLYEKLFDDWFPTWRERLINVPPNNLLDAVATYDIVWANSQFTQQWAREYWQMETDICYPQIEVERFQPLPKKRQIVSVGRFFREGHNKKHLVMVQAFKELVDNGLTDWSLHLAGGVIQEKLHLEYVDAVRDAAAGYPIELHVDMPFEQLRTLYGESAIYWHAAGYGESAAREPVKLEHFGITTVEAMAAGCVPVVIARGGQIEVLEDGITGFHWQTIDELKEQTLRLCSDEPLRDRMSQAAIQRSREYDRAHFETRLVASLASIGCTL